MGRSVSGVGGRVPGPSQPYQALGGVASDSPGNCSGFSSKAHSFWEPLTALLPQGVLTLPCVEGAAGHGVWWLAAGRVKALVLKRLYRALRGVWKGLLCCRRERTTRTMK